MGASRVLSLPGTLGSCSSFGEVRLVLIPSGQVDDRWPRDRNVDVVVVGRRPLPLVSIAAVLRSSRPVSFLEGLVGVWLTLSSPDLNGCLLYTSPSPRD